MILLLLLVMMLQPASAEPLRFRTSPSGATVSEQGHVLVESGNAVSLDSLAAHTPSC